LWLIEREPIYEPLWGYSEFRVIVAEIRVDMAEQLVRVRERSGELELTPEISSTTH
jgi:hypothetical protein